MDLVGDPPVRKQLDALVALPVDQQSDALSRMDAQPDIELVQLADEGRAFNCFAYAFGLVGLLHDDPVMSQLATPDALDFGRDIHPDGCFVRWLWINGLIIDGRGGDVLLYFAGRRPAHAAKRVASGVFVSKWGGGHIWRHDIDSVPSAYGDRCALVKAADVSVEDAYRKYVRSVYPVAWQRARA